MAVTITVVIPVRLAQSTIESTLEAAIGQAREVGGEVVVAICRSDPSYSIVESIAARESEVLRLVTSGEPCGVPQLRRDGVRAARARWVVITEDHCLFRSGWLAGMLRGAGDVRGGAVANGRNSYAGWAQYFSRYAAFMPPVQDGPAAQLPGNNACYARHLLDSESIEEGFWEAELNRKLAERGVQLFMCSGLTIAQRQQRDWLEFASLRFRHGRCYGGQRGGSTLLALLRGPLIPAILIWRILRAESHKRYKVGWFVVTFPLLAFYILAWSLGEEVGYLAGPGHSCRSTD
jgi:hypothetical protein